MARVVRISTIQMKLVASRTDDPAEARASNITRVISQLHTAGERGSDIVLLPETFSHAGIAWTAERLNAHAETTDGELMAQLSAISRQYGMHIVASVHLRESDRICNSCVFLDRTGTIGGIYHKLHLTEPEKAYGVQPGRQFQTFELDFGTVGAIICHDNSFVESARCTALLGAEIIFWPHFQSGWGEVMWETQLKSRAIDNGCIVVSSSYSDKSASNHWEPGRFLGRSNIVNDDGIILADAGREASVVTADVDLDNKRRAHSFCCNGVVDYRDVLMANRLPAAYRLIAEPRPEILTSGREEEQ